MESVTEREYRKSIVLAEAVLAWAERIIRSTEAREAPAVYKVGKPRRKKRNRK